MKTDPDIRILFFDVGNVLVSDDPSALFIYRRTFERLCAMQDGDAPTIEEFFDARTAFARKGGMLWDFVEALIDDGSFRQFQMVTRRDLYNDWETYSPPIPGMHEAIRELYDAGWRLGILANQPPEVERLLRARRLWDLFEVHAVSDVLGYSKPDPRLFERAMEKAGVSPSESLMIGDRVDNDVAPAKALGMRTMQICLSYEERGWQPEDAFGEAYVHSATAANISGKRAEGAHEEPDYLVRTPRELVKVISALRAEG